MTTDGAGALGAFLPQLSVIEAPYLWRDAAHMAKVAGSPLFAQDERRAGRQARHAHAGRHLLRQAPPDDRHARRCKTVADMAGFKLRVPPVDTFRAMAEAWGAQATPINFNELYLALSQGAVDGQENPLPTIQSAKLYEVQKFLVLTGHIITPRLVIVNEAFWKGLAGGRPRRSCEAAIADGAAWQDTELAGQEATPGRHLQGRRHDGDRARPRELPQAGARRRCRRSSRSKWGKGTWDALAAL